MNINQQDLAKALRELNENYPNTNGNNKASIGGTATQNITGLTYNRCSMKRSHFQNLNYNRCLFENNAFSASSFCNVTFMDSKLSGNSLACCNFFDCQFSNSSKGNILYVGNNFSQSNFTTCGFKDAVFKSSGFLQSLFYNCQFYNIDFQSNTLEGSSFNNCYFGKINAGHTNVEFVELINTELNNVTFPFYQFAYVIGASDFIKENSEEISFMTSDKKVTSEEYFSQIDNLILYYLDKQEYFPACNLLIAKGEVYDAQSVFLNGINLALDTLDFRMMRHFCRLAKRHDLLDEVTIHRTRRKIENYLFNESIPIERINDFIINAGEIRKILLSGKNNSVTYNFNIRTNVQKSNAEGIEYVNTLSNELNDALSRYDVGQLGFQVAVSCHSPFEILVDVICAAGALATIAQLVWTIVENHKVNTNSEGTRIPDEYIPADQALYVKYIDHRIELCKEQLLNIKAKYSEKKMNQYIEEITQQLKTDITELYNKDIMIFRKNNTEDK